MSAVEFCSDEVYHSLHNSAPLNFSDQEFAASGGARFFDSVDVPLHGCGRALEVILPPAEGRGRKLLVCHDLRGNYLNDRSHRGDAFKNAFQLTDWSLVDVFCYFSHNMISIPPLGWIHASHAHGVKAIGTFLTEWDKGRDICSKLFASEAMVDKLVDLLVQISKTCSVDGWLVNIENTLDDVLISNMKYFLRRLSAKMHQLNEESKVLWYDAVTVRGQLRWQNKLSSLNKDFFDCCDGVFLNYGWRADTPVVSALLAGMHRRCDVFFGIDCWGRGTFGGGRHDCDRALAVLSAQGVSAALFAPGFVLECEVDEDQDFECVQASIVRKYACFWAKAKTAWTRSRASATPCYVNFSQAAGRHLFVRGKAFSHWAVAEGQPFYDLSLQRGNWDAASLVAGSTELCYSEGFDGTASLRVLLCGGEATAVPIVTCILSNLDELQIDVCLRSAHAAVRINVFVTVGSLTATEHSFALTETTHGWEIRSYCVSISAAAASRAAVGLSMLADEASSVLVGWVRASQPSDSSPAPVAPVEPMRAAACTVSVSGALSFRLERPSSAAATVDVFALSCEELRALTSPPTLPVPPCDTLRLYTLPFSAQVDMQASERTMLARVAAWPYRISVQPDSPVILSAALLAGDKAEDWEGWRCIALVVQACDEVADRGLGESTCILLLFHCR